MKGTQVAAAVVALSLGGIYLWHARERAKTAPIAVASAGESNAGSGSMTALAAGPGVSVAPVEPPVPATVQDNGSANTPAQHTAPKVDIVFAIDTTSSMSALIEGAKAKIWEIARRAQQGKPAPQLRVGLVAYRDRGDAYLTKVLDLTSDMDSVYAHLTELRAEGGGDTPEHVLKGLSDSVQKEHWSQDPDAVKLIYLVGDAPPHTDYQDGITLDGVVKGATRAGIRISAIRCGNDPNTLASWTEIARRTDGEVSTIAQGGGVAMRTTPYDAELARLNAALAKTEIHYGSAAERHDSDESVARGLAAPAAAQAERASFYGSVAAARIAPTKKDLAASPSPAPLASVAAAELPEDMQAMTADQRTRFVEEKRAERSAILAQVVAESAKRDEYLKAKSPAPDTSFDAKVYDSLKKAGARKGIAY